MVSSTFPLTKWKRYVSVQWVVWHNACTQRSQWSQVTTDTPLRRQGETLACLRVDATFSSNMRLCGQRPFRPSPPFRQLFGASFRSEGSLKRMGQILLQLQLGVARCQSAMVMCGPRSVVTTGNEAKSSEGPPYMARASAILIKFPIIEAAERLSDGWMHSAGWTKSTGAIFLSMSLLLLGYPL